MMRLIDSTSALKDRHPIARFKMRNEFVKLRAGDIECHSIPTLWMPLDDAEVPYTRCTS